MSKKVVLKKIIGHCVYCFKKHMNLSTENQCRVLMYHSISDNFLFNDDTQMTTPLSLFEAQMAFLYENNYHVISSEEMVDSLILKKRFPDKTVVLTFDDGFKDNLKIVPILEKYHFQATIFITISYMEEGTSYLSSGEIKCLSNSKLFTIGSHTLSHPLLKKLADTDLEREVVMSKKILENIVLKPVHFFAYPFGSYGAYDQRAVKFLKQAGYKAAFSTVAGLNDYNQDCYQIKRTRVSGFDIISEFQKELYGAYDWYKVWQYLRRTPPVQL